MKVLAPTFFRDFRCTGSECRDNCCRIGWDIEIDDSTYSYYRSLDCGLCEHISDEGGEHRIIQQDGQCPFLDENGLCSVVLRFGEQHISEICTQHPRFYQWFGSYKEAGTGLCCEESARLWLTNAGNIRFCEWETDEEPDDLGFDPKLLKSVRAAREMLIGLLQRKDMTLSEKLKALLIFGLNTQDFTPEDAADGFSELTAVFSDEAQLKELLSQAAVSVGGRLDAYRQVLSYLSELEYMGAEFPGVISGISERLTELEGCSAELFKSFPEAEDRLCAAAVYNVYRYFIDCARGAECLPVMMYTLINVWFVELWCIMQFKDGCYGLGGHIEAVKEFSKEIEYSDNTDRIFEDIYTDSRLNANNMLLLTEV